MPTGRELAAAARRQPGRGHPEGTSRHDHCDDSLAHSLSLQKATPGTRNAVRRAGEDE